MDLQPMELYLDAVLIGLPSLVLSALHIPLSLKYRTLRMVC